MVVYLRNLKRWKNNLAKSESRPDWKQNLNLAASRVVLTIQGLFQSGRFITPVGYADEATAMVPNCLALQAIRACAIMLQGNRDKEAREIFLRHRGKLIEATPWEELVREHFSILRKGGCERQLMGEIEKRFAGLDVSDLPDDVTCSGGQSPHIGAAVIEKADISAGDALQARGMPDQALVVYERCLDDCKAKIEKFANGQFNLRVVEDRSTLVTKLADLAVLFLADRNIEKAQAATKSALAALPGSAVANIRHAHALMFLERVDEAKELYLRYRTEQIDPQANGAHLILHDIELMRQAGVAHPLMLEVEEALSSCESSPPS
jgi:tetratricopeptide (TPR) repeat protein